MADLFVTVMVLGSAGAAMWIGSFLAHSSAQPRRWKPPPTDPTHARRPAAPTGSDAARRILRFPGCRRRPPAGWRGAASPPRGTGRACRSGPLLSTTTTISGLFDEARTSTQDPSSSATRTPLTVITRRSCGPGSCRRPPPAPGTPPRRWSTTPYFTSSAQCGHMVRRGAGDGQGLLQLRQLLARVAIQHLQHGGGRRPGRRRSPGRSGALKKKWPDFSKPARAPSSAVLRLM